MRVVSVNSMGLSFHCGTGADRRIEWETTRRLSKPTQGVDDDENERLLSNMKKNIMLFVACEWENGNLLVQMKR